ncbi:small ribosomal subunit protein uS14m [Halyomorpha halys]|uniref:small ribosomal subunit protein uS14m n=1 Tax=Halyomorpha halys TaxID=286706 RepID=UPI0006D4D3CB|nr:28S ribosomal protein S14, mitochondrial [Halyomorpha halys]
MHYLNNVYTLAAKNLGIINKAVSYVPQSEQVRTMALLWPDWRMKKDVRKRRNLAAHADTKLRIQCIRKNDVLPREIREIADKEIEELPNDCLGPKIVNRCAFTSRPRGVVYRWRASRIVFRDFADHNQMSGVQRALW